jgi:hypothetical protein
LKRGFVVESSQSRHPDVGRVAYPLD